MYPILWTPATCLNSLISNKPDNLVWMFMYLWDVYTCHKFKLTVYMLKGTELLYNHWSIVNVKFSDMTFLKESELIILVELQTYPFFAVKWK